MARLLSKILAQSHDLSGEAQLKGYQAAGHGIASYEAYAGKLLSAFGVSEQGRVGTLSLPDSYPQSLVEPLTEREIEVLCLIAEGLSNREIARRLFISPSTVKRHTSKIYGKLDVHSRTQAVARARALGILSPDMI